MVDIFDFVSDRTAKEHRRRNIRCDIKQNCEKCKLYNFPLTPQMPPSGEAIEGYLVGEEPGEKEDKVGRQFYEKAQAGRFLRVSMRSVGLDPAKWRMNNAIQCRKPGNKAPTKKEIDFCKVRVHEDIRISKPKVIIAFGNPAIYSFLGQEGVTKFRGRCMPYPELNAWLCPIMHPSAVKRGEEEGKKENNAIFRADLAAVARLVRSGREAPVPKEVVVRQLRKFREIKSFLSDTLVNYPEFGVDFETVHIRPYLPTSKLVAAGITVDGNIATTFPVEKSGELTKKEQKVILKLLRRRLSDGNINKTVHNIGMEYEWTVVYLGVPLGGRIDDTQRMAYALDVRRGCHSLAFITLVNFGAVWKDAVAKYKHNMDLCPTELCLDYVGKDVVWTMRNKQHYLPVINADGKLKNLYENILMKGAVACTDVQISGALVDQSYIGVLDEKLKKDIQKTEKRLRKNKMVHKYERLHHRHMNFDSDDQVRELLYEKPFFDLEPIAFTDKLKRGSTKANVLHDYAEQGIEICEDLALHSELSHYKNTWVDGVSEQIYPDGMFHQSLNNTFTRTGRLSSNDPNMQNFPSRGGHKYVRDMVVAPPGWVIVGGDYDQLEALCLGIESGDEHFRQAYIDNYDIHLEKSREIHGSKLAKDKRSKTKNKFVFRVFYGGGAKAVAYDFGISEAQAQRHIDKLLVRDFPRIREWQFETVDFYKEHLYVESRTGRRRYGPLSRNKIFNTPVQGLAADFCQWAMIILTLRGYWIWANVHDALYAYVREENLERDVVRIKRCMEGVPIEWTDGVPVRVSMQIGYKWGSLEDVSI